VPYKYLVLFALLCVSPLSSSAQAPCTFDFAAAIDLLENNPTLDQVAEARALIQLQESNCRDYAPDDAGSSRTNPVPFGQRQQVVIDDEFDGSIQIVDFLDDAEAYVLEASSSNEPAPDGARFVVIRFAFACERSPDESCEFNLIYFAAVGDKGIVYDYSSEDRFDAENIWGIGDDQEIFGGSEIEVEVAFLVDEDDDHLLLFNDLSDTRIFFATE
jgi:hypothetical protein